MSKALTDLLAKRFIQRRDVKAIQRVLQDGSVLYTPHGRRERDGSYSEYYPWTREALNQHLAGEAAYGHYLLDQDSKVKLFAFDIDLEKIGWLPVDEEYTDFRASTPRDDWRTRHMVHQRAFIKLQFKQLAHMFLKSIEETLGIPSAAAYSGGKGIHVYGFTGSVAAWEAREGAMIVLNNLDRFEPLRGQNFFHDKLRDDLHEGFGNFSIELFPKQDSLDGKDLGNLMRLPLGRNLKNPKDPTFFIDMTSPLAQMVPVDPEWALTTNSVWKRPGE